MTATPRADDTQVDEPAQEPEFVDVEVEGDIVYEYYEGPDSVAHAVQTPDEVQPFEALGLRDDEYARIRQILGRRPTQSELAMYSIMWSEHCSYKSSKVHLRQFVEKAPPSDRMLAGIGENAGVIRISEDLAVTFKVESHNHPSFVEPHQGAATGIGGIVRDILAMGARPVAVMDPLRFGAADHPDTRRVLPGVVAGIGGYGNCLGLPNIGGELVFDPCYQGNPLVNALCVGVLPVDRLQRKEATGPGNIVVLMGAKTGRDGIGGVSVLASATFDHASDEHRPSVQVGDPFIEKLLIESCLELYERQLIVGVQDLGGAGLTCALTETAASASTGMAVVLDRVPLREPSMEPHEILASESQERMLLIVEPANLDAVLRVAERWGVYATALGEVTAPAADGSPGRLVISWHDEVVVDVPPGSLVDDGPVYARPMREPSDLILLQADRAETLPRPKTGADLRETVLRLAASPNLCDKTWVTEQYDRYVLGNTVLAQPEDAGMLRIDEQTGRGIALSVDGNSRYARLDPYAGAKLALAEAYRNVATTGAVPIAVTNCLNFGSPEDPVVMWQFAEAVRGLADGCAELEIPVTGGNVSFYNSTGAAAIHPTPVVGVLGVTDDVASRVPMGFRHEGDLVLLLGETAEELSGSEWAWVTFAHLGGRPPAVNLTHERILAGVLTTAAELGHISAAHDLSDGGLAQALVESCLRYGVGATILLPEGLDPFVALFSESTARAIVAVPRGHETAFTGLCEEYNLPYAPIGVVDPSSGVLDVGNQFTIPLDELRAVWSATLPALFGDPAVEGPAPTAETADPGPPVPGPPVPGTPASTVAGSGAPGPGAADADVSDAQPSDAEPSDAQPSDVEVSDVEVSDVEASVVEAPDVQASVVEAPASASAHDGQAPASEPTGVVDTELIKADPSGETEGVPPAPSRNGALDGDAALDGDVVQDGSDGDAVAHNDGPPAQEAAPSQPDGQGKNRGNGRSRGRRDHGARQAPPAKPDQQ